MGSPSSAAAIQGGLEPVRGASHVDEFIDRLALQPNWAERVRVMRDEMGPWLDEYVPGVAIGAAHAIAGVGPKAGEWPPIPGHMDAGSRGQRWSRRPAPVDD